MTALLDQFENRIYNEWKSNVDEICEFNLNQPLVKFSAVSGLLNVNFDPKVRVWVNFDPKVFLKCFIDALFIIRIFLIPPFICILFWENVSATRIITKNNF